MLFLEEIARPLLSFHMFISLIALAALGFSAYLMYKQNAIDWNSGVKAAWLGTLAYIASFFLGLVIYPVFRVNVRANYFDKSLQWATAIFEIKEHVAALSFFAALALMALLLSLKKNEPSQVHKQFAINMVVLLFLVTLASAAVGLVLSALKRM